MKLLGVRLARSIWLVPQHFLNPSGFFLRVASLEMKSRYQFLKSPFDNNTAGTGEVKYENGGFKTKRGAEITITSLTLHGDGMVVDGFSSTDDCDEFLEDALEWLRKDYGIPSSSKIPIRRIYGSELNVIVEKPPTFLNPKLTPFIDAVSSMIGSKTMGGVGFLGFQLTTDPEASPRPAQFRLEREINTSINDNRYYSFAPLKTSEHIKLLETLEAVL